MALTSRGELRLEGSIRSCRRDLACLTVTTGANNLNLLAAGGFRQVRFG